MKVRKEMESTIFTPNVINQINEFVDNTLYEGLISGFDIRDAEEFDEVIEAAENGQTEFELNVDLEQMADPDVFERLLARFMDNYIFDQEYRYMTGLKITVDKEANALEVSAGLVLSSYSGPMPNIETFIVDCGRVFDLDEYVHNLLREGFGSEDEHTGDEYDEYDREFEELREQVRSRFVNAEQFNSSKTVVSTIISLEE